MTNLISDSFLKEDPETPVRISPDHILQAVFDVISRHSATAADISSFGVGECDTSYAEMSGSRE